MKSKDNSSGSIFEGEVEEQSGSVNDYEVDENEELYPQESLMKDSSLIATPNMEGEVSIEYQGGPGESNLVSMREETFENLDEEYAD